MALLVLLLVIGLLIMLARKGKKHTASARTEQQMQADELITVILPTINKDS